MIVIETEINTEGMAEAEIDAIVGKFLDNVAEAARDKWIELAEESDLGQTKETYIKGIGPVESPSATERTIDMEGFLPVGLEYGLSPFDMKPGLLAGKKYQDIPFLYGGPGSTDKTPLSRQTFNRVKSLKRGERFSTKLGRSKYEGLQKAQKSDGKNSFVKFRRVSQNSDPNSWIHPGLTPLMLSEQVKKYLEDNVSKFIEVE